MTEMKITTLDTDATIGLYASCICEKISIGKVRISGETINSDTVTLSNEVKKANNPPEIIAGRMSGNVTFQNTTTGLAPKNSCSPFEIVIKPT